MNNLSRFHAIHFMLSCSYFALLFLFSFSSFCFVASKALAQESTQSVSNEAEIKALLSSWDSLCYNLKSAGAEKASFSAEFSSQSTLSPEPLKGAFRYQWDLLAGGNFDFDQSELEHSIAKGGFDVSDIQAYFQPRSLQQELSKNELSFAKQDGKKQILVKGANSRNVTALEFSDHGLLEKLIFVNPDGLRSGSKTYKYKKIKDSYTPSEIKMKLSIKDMGELELLAKMEFSEQGGFTVWKSYSGTISMEDQLLAEVSIRFSNFKVKAVPQDKSKDVDPKEANPKAEEKTKEPEVGKQDSEAKKSEGKKTAEKESEKKSTPAKKGRERL